MKKELQPLTIKRIKSAHAERRAEILEKLSEFGAVWQAGTDERIWEEMVFCFFTGGCSAKMGLRSIEAVRQNERDQKQTLIGQQQQLEEMQRSVEKEKSERAKLQTSLAATKKLVAVW